VLVSLVKKETRYKQKPDNFFYDSGIEHNPWRASAETKTMVFPLRVAPPECFFDGRHGVRAMLFCHLQKRVGVGFLAVHGVSH